VTGVLLLAVSTAVAQPPPDSLSRPVRVGLALSGGAALGLAHIGVLRVLEREGIPVVGISGNSMGSMVGGVCAAGYSPAEIESIAVNADWGTLFSSGVPFGAQYLPERQQAQRYVFQLRHRNFVPYLPGGLVPLQNVEFLLMRLLSDVEYNTYYDFDSLPIPYRAIAVDLVSGDKVVFRSGRLEQAIRASIAIPGVFVPEDLGGQELVDGGVQQYLPVAPLLDMKPDVIIAVLTMKHNAETGISLIDIASRSMDVVGMEDMVRQKALADVLIQPNVDPFTHSDFARAKELIAAGEAAAEAALPEIRARLAGRTPVAVRRTVTVRPYSVVRSVRFEGRHVTRSSTLRPELRTRPGSYLKFPVLRDDLMRLFRTGLFDDVNYRLNFGPADSVDVVIELQEKAYGFYSLGIRFDSDDNVALGLEVGQGNLGGSGASLRAALDLGNPRELRLGLTGTRLFRFPFGYRLDGFWGSIDRTYFDSTGRHASYRTAYRGGIAEAGYIIGRNAFFDFGVAAYDAAYPLPHPARPVFESVPGHEWIVGPMFRLESNSFQDIDFPTRGAGSRLDVLFSSRAMKATREFLKIDYAWDQVVPVSSRLLLRPGLAFGVCLNEPAWVEQFHTGGDDMVGFAKGEFTSPQRAVLRLGADVMLFRLFNQANYPVYLQFFSNAGTFEPLNQALNATDPVSVLHWGAGTGLRTNTPLGPVQLIFGVGDFGKPVPGSGARVNVFLSVGREFRYTR